MSITGPILLYGAGREAASSRKLLGEIAPNAQIDVCVDSGEANIPDTTLVPVSTIIEAFNNKHYSMVVRSPGVSIYKDELIAAKNAGIEVTTNVNLWATYRRGSTKVIALTGTKGKSTTAKLIFTILQTHGYDVGLAGNIGVPVTDLPSHDYVVLELSSFQCADLQLNPNFIGITSLFPEHLDWHGDAATYFADKMNILRRKAIYSCALSPQISAHPDLPQPPKGLVNKLPNLTLRFGEQVVAQVARSKLKGNHNLQNALLGARLAMGAGASEKSVLNGIAAFEPLPHRLQEFLAGGKTFVNDSIATNPEATKAAITAYADQKVALIIGGFDRDQDFTGLANSLRNAPVSSIWFLPDTGHRIAKRLSKHTMPMPIHIVETFEQIFEHLKADPDQFDVLLLSPGAPSFNQFKNFEKRGEAFLTLAAQTFGA
ncbi:MAG: UDP-N-acetylmuramoyl-L-alanine--D-glutamate ligase [Devosiaceae bacterium]|nr:UDP-N-acetylmuramoyl-L-alanine--D-glutamate ligase [Devosiaceae bacterium]